MDGHHSFKYPALRRLRQLLRRSRGEAQSPKPVSHSKEPSQTRGVGAHQAMAWSRRIRASSSRSWAFSPRSWRQAWGPPPGGAITAVRRISSILGRGRRAVVDFPTRHLDFTSRTVPTEGKKRISPFEHHFQSPGGRGSRINEFRPILFLSALCGPLSAISGESPPVGVGGVLEQKRKKTGQSPEGGGG